MDIANLFKEKLKNQSIDAPDNLWSRIEGNMNISDNLFNQQVLEKTIQTKSSTSLLSKVGIWKIASAAAAVTAVVSATIVFILPNDSEQPIKTSQDAPSLVSESVANAERITTDSMPSKKEVLVNTEEANVLPSISELKNTIPAISKREPTVQHVDDNQDNNSVEKKSPEPTLIGTAPTNPVQEKQTVPQENKITQPASSTTDDNISNETNPKISASPVESKTEITAEQSIKIQAANFITPNGDGKNDIWIITNLEKLTSYLLQITDKRGKRVLETNNYQNNWNGDNLPEGTYYYTLKYLYNGKESFQRGIIEIIRN